MMKKKACGVIFSSLILFNLISCNHTSQKAADVATTTPDSSAHHHNLPTPEWAQNATIYEVNTRQFSNEGTFKAVEEQLTRLREMGVTILWFMPIHPISQDRRKGTLGNPYAVQDYKAINPEFGTLDDFKALVKRAHDLGMHVLIDWVPNHTGWDHAWVKQHPDWYTQIKGKMVPPVDDKGQLTDRSDVINLNYDNPALRAAMIDAMQYWVRECDIDGYRCEVAAYLPNDFWAQVRPELDKIKTVFMLGEWEDNPELFETCFNMNYGWRMHQLMKQIAKGQRPATAIDSLLDMNRKRFPAGYYQMHFIQTHDENAWHGTVAESFGNGGDAFTTLSFTFDGMPLVYNGMEANLSRRIKFYDKDPIYWGNYGKADFYKTLLTLKRRNRALWNGLSGGPLVKISTGIDDKVYAFYRQRDNDRVMAIINLSPAPQTIRLTGDGFEGMYTEVFSRQPTEMHNTLTLALKPWEYKVYTN